MIERVAYNLSTDLTVLNCANCGMLFAIPTRYERDRRGDHKTFFCPNGHSNYFHGKSEAEKLREQLAEEERRRKFFQRSSKRWEEQATSESYRARAEKAAKTRLKNRIKHGVCPCCKRTFKDVQQHMKNKHPEFVGEGQ